MESVFRPVSVLREDERRALVDAVCTCQGRDVDELERALDGGVPRGPEGAAAGESKARP